jgi:hypothetical protein
MSDSAVPPTLALFQPSTEVLSARQALDDAVAALDAISPECPRDVSNYPTVDQTWLAYAQQEVRVDLVKAALHRAVLEHYTEQTGMPTGLRRNP